MNEERNPADHWFWMLVRAGAWFALVVLFVWAMLRCDERVSRHEAEWAERQPKMTQSIPSPPRVSRED